MNNREALVERLLAKAVLIDELAERQEKIKADYFLPPGSEADLQFASDLRSAASLLSQPEPQGTASDRDRARAEGVIKRSVSPRFSGTLDAELLRDAIASALAGEREAAEAKARWWAEHYEHNGLSEAAGACLSVAQAIHAGAPESTGRADNDPAAIRTGGMINEKE